MTLFLDRLAQNLKKILEKIGILLYLKIQGYISFSNKNICMKIVISNKSKHLESFNMD